ncbi:MAG: hypothetical protein EOO50_06745 [Flavobacterium sp.]|uniref:hypothetical protein n=1 Tax=Flavobacterium sp. TaxID=239 RepID=UPI00121C5174|nr:hypothetical protein [Flavobacterium sp.]RZJ67215.1 MAG: hypothetical protein EOO50_06745 [Flavobacterium sp.]
MKRFLLIALLLCCALSWSQKKRKSLQGKVLIGELVAEDGEVRIRNMSSGEKVATLPGGFFTLAARANDTLLFQSPDAITRKMVITSFDMDEELVIVDLDPTGTQLKEVVVDKNKITSESVGLPQGKEYTQAERKLESATTTKSQRPADQAYTAIGTDGVLNKLSGRTAQLKKEAEVEKKQAWKQRLSERYEKQYFIDTLKLPSDHVEGFLFYAVEDKKFMETLQSENDEEIQLQLGVLATRYKKTLKK